MGMAPMPTRAGPPPHQPPHIPTANRDRCPSAAILHRLTASSRTGYDSRSTSEALPPWGSRTPATVVGRPGGRQRPAARQGSPTPRNGHREARCREFNQPATESSTLTYGLLDGDLQEGIASEAASLAGHLKLGRIVYLYDDNHIQLDGPTAMAFSEDVLARFRAYGWHTLRVKDGTDVGAIEAAIRLARSDDRPSIIAVRTVIGFGSPNKAGSQKAHGAPLGPEEVRLTKEAYGWDPDKSFFVPDAVAALFSRAIPWGESSPAAGTRRWSATGRPSRKRPRSWSGASTATCAAAGTPPSRAGRPARRSPPETPAPTRSTPLRRACRSSSAARRTSPSQT